MEKNRIISLLLCLAMLFSFIPAGASADDEGFEDEEIISFEDILAGEDASAQPPEENEQPADEDETLDEDDAQDEELFEEEEYPEDEDFFAEDEDEIPEQPELEEDGGEEYGSLEDFPFPLSVTHVNPLYEGIISESDIPLAPEFPVGEGINTFNADYTDLDTAAGQLAAGIAARKSTVTVYIKVSKNADFWLEVYNMESRALRHTGNPVYGDYIDYQYGGANYRMQEYRSDKTYYYAAIVFSPYYFTTAAQENAVSGKVSQIVSSLGLRSASLSDYDKITRIYSYMCKNIRYDYTHMNDDSYVLKFTVYAALCQGSAVCQGIATAFYRLCLEAGIGAARVVSCDAMCHSWNIVDPGVGKYYYADVTWDLGGGTTYFLKGWNNYARNHSSLGVSDPGDIAPMSYVRESDGNIYLYKAKANAVYLIDTKDFNKADLPAPSTVKITLPAPVITSAANYADYIKVVWNPVAGAESYRLSYRHGSGAWVKYCDTVSTAIKFTAAEDGETYTFKVECYSKDGKLRMSEESNRIGQMRLTTPALKVNRFGNPGESGGFRLSWTATEGGSQYKIYYREAGGTWVLYTMIPKSYGTLFCNIKAEICAADSKKTNLVPGRTYEFMVLTATSQASVTSGYPTPFISVKY